MFIMSVHDNLVKPDLIRIWKLCNVWLESGWECEGIPESLTTHKSMLTCAKRKKVSCANVDWSNNFSCVFHSMIFIFFYCFVHFNYLDCLSKLLHNKIHIVAKQSDLILFTYFIKALVFA